MKIRRLQHVSSPFADGDQDALRTFYGDVLGLREIPTPPTLEDLELLWFSAGDGVELHFFRGSADPPRRVTSAWTSKALTRPGND